MVWVNSASALTPLKCSSSDAAFPSLRAMASRIWWGSISRQQLYRASRAAQRSSSPASPVSPWGSGRFLDETLKYYFNNDLNGLKNLFEKVKDLSYVVTNNIVKCFYFLKIRDYDAFIEAFKELSVIRETLGYFEANCYIFLAIEYYIKMYNFKKALYYLRSFELLENKNRYLNYLIIEANILVSAFLKVSSRLVVYYYKLIQISFAGYPNGRLMEMRMLYNLSISDEFSYDVLDDIESINFDLIPSDNRFNILFYIYLIKLKLTNYQTIFDDIYKNGYFIDSRFLGLLGGSGGSWRPAAMAPAPAATARASHLSFSG